MKSAECTGPMPSFECDLEFAYLSDYWTVPGARVFGDPAKGREKVAADVQKIGLHLADGACRVGYVIAFADCDFEFSETFLRQTRAAAFASSAATSGTPRRGL